MRIQNLVDKNLKLTVKHSFQILAHDPPHLFSQVGGDIGKCKARGPIPRYIWAEGVKIQQHLLILSQHVPRL